MIEIDDVTVRLGGRLVLDRVSARVERGGWLGLVGPNGSGKTTLLRAVVGLIVHDGTIRVDGDPAALARRRRAARLVAYVPQRPVLPPTMRLTDYVMLGRSPHLGLFGFETARDRRLVAAVLERLGLEALADRLLGQVSGGEAQRAVLARALAQQAPVLVMDEPTAALDLGHGQEVLELADELRRERGLSVLSALHDLTIAGQYADELLLLSGGRPVASGRPPEVLTEQQVRRHFGAAVELLHSASGIAVVPVRRHR